MKVIHFIGGGDVGGAKTHVLSLIGELSKKIEVKLVSLRPGAFSDDAKATGIDIDVVRTRNIFSDVKKLISIIRQGNYEIIHSHGAKANMMAVIVSHFTSVPVVTTVHSDYKLDYMHSKSKKYSFGLINSVALRFIDYYISVSSSIKKQLLERNFNKEKVFLLNNGIDFNTDVPTFSRQDFLKKHKLDLAESTLLVGILARLTPVKGVDIFLDAARKVLEQKPEVHFLIGGDGEQRKELEQKTRSLGISANVHFLGFINEPYEFLSNIDVSVLSSRSEGFPYSILEGARMKKPTVSSDVGGIADLIETNETGFLFDPGDYKKLAEYTVRLAEDENLRRQMGEGIYDKAKMLFSLESMRNTQLDIYEKILSKK